MAMAQYMLDLVYSLTNCMCCFPGTPRLKINNRSFKILRLLGEGGFSYVYLVQDVADGSLHALKKIRCPFGQESVAQALKEVEAYALFARAPNIIRAEDYSIVADRADPGAKTVYILLPYYRRGNLQDMINANLVNHTRFPERQLMGLFLGVCRALKAMHQYRVRGDANAAGAGDDGEQQQQGEGEEGETEEDGGALRNGRRSKGGGGGVNGTGSSSNRAAAQRVRNDAARADKEAAQEASKAARRVMRSRGRRVADGNEDGDDAVEHEPLIEGGEVTRAQDGVAEGEIRAYAHRDIKPGNIMIADDGVTPILMDLGSLAPAPTRITSRSAALAVQDTAAEQSTMPYRAPELFDVKTGATIDTKVDIWSLGCTLYACLVGKSPFEARSEETGGSLSLCVLGGDWRFPDEPQQRPHAAAAAQQAQQQKQQQQQQQQQGRLPSTSGGGSGGASAAGERSADPAAASTGGGGATTGGGGEWSAGVKNVVRRCLQVEPADRPDIDELIAMVERVLDELEDS